MHKSIEKSSYDCSFTFSVLFHFACEFAVSLCGDRLISHHANQEEPHPLVQPASGGAVLGVGDAGTIKYATIDEALAAAACWGS